MTQQRSVPPGWYDDPCVPAQRRWWDGARWTGMIQPMALATPLRSDRSSLGRGFDRLSSGLLGTLVLLALIDLVGVGFHAWTSTVIGAWLKDPSTYDLGSARRMDEVSALLGIAGLTLGFLAFVLLVSWLNLAAHSSDVEPAALRHQPGWAIGAWFVPFLNLVRPVQMVQDVRAGAIRSVTPSAFVPASPLVMWWWGTFLASRITATLVSGNSHTQGLHGTALLSALKRDHAGVALEFALHAAAAVLGALVVRSVTGALVRARDVRRGAQLTPGVEARPSTGAAPR